MGSCRRGQRASLEALSAIFYLHMNNTQKRVFNVMTLEGLWGIIQPNETKWKVCILLILE